MKVIAFSVQYIGNKRCVKTVEIQLLRCSKAEAKSIYHSVQVSNEQQSFNGNKSCPYISLICCWKRDIMSVYPAYEMCGHNGQDLMKDVYHKRFGFNRAPIPNKH